MRFTLAISCFLLATRAVAGPYAPAAGQLGSTAVAADDPGLIAWGSSVGQVVRGPYDISDPESPLVTFGNPDPAAIGPADGFDSSGQPLTDPNKVVSLGDGGSVTVLFNDPIANGSSWDFAVFENAFNDTFLELAFVEVFDGDTWARFPTNSLTQTTIQIDQTSATTNGLDPTEIDGFAGKYRAGFGTPFDLSTLIGTPGLDINHIIAVKVVDVVGSIDPTYARRDSFNRIINDPWPTPFSTGGFDLDAIGAFHIVPEPGSAISLLAGCLCLGMRRKRLSGCQVIRLSGSGGEYAAGDVRKPDNLTTRYLIT
jgi:hypothetical protein